MNFLFLNMSKARGSGYPLDGVQNVNIDTVDMVDEISLGSTQSKFKNEKTIFYSKNDNGPFVVYLESTVNVGYNIGKFNNIKIAREIFNLNLTDIKRINNKGLNRISVEFINFQSANNFLKNKTLIEKGYKIFIPYNFVTCKGIVRQIDADLTEEEILKFCKANNGIEILQVKRLNRKVFKNNVVIYEPTGTVLFTFKGIILPRSINLYRLERPVNVYIPPVTQCYRCLRFGHTKNNCKGKERCFNCGEEENHLQDGEVKFSCVTQCFYCKDDHKSSSKKCPEYSRQKNIKELMALENLTFYEASETCKKSYISNGEFFLNNNNFPELIKKRNGEDIRKKNDNIIKPSERRTQYFQNSVKRSFQQVISENSAKKRIVHKGVDKKARDDCLFFPNSRSQKQDFSNLPSTSSNTSSISHNSKTEPGSAIQTFEFHQNDELHNCINFIMNTSRENKSKIKNLLFSSLDFEQDIGF